jgi:hypothetical protein
MDRAKAVEEAHKLLEEAAVLLTELVLRVQLVRYLPVELVVPAIFMAAAAAVEATTVEAVAVLTPTVPATTLELAEADLLLLIRSTHQTSPTSLG